MGIFNFFKNRKKKSQNNVVCNIDTSAHKGICTSKSIELDLTSIKQIRNSFIAFDVETTGLDSTSDRIVELGAVIFSNGKTIKTFSSLVNPGRLIPESASAINHITNTMISTAPCEKEIYPELIEFLGEALQGNVAMCAYNARFDFGFLCNTLSRLGFSANIEYVDTLTLARKYIRGLDNYKQSSVEAYLGLTNAASHRAANDAENCGYIFCRLLNSAEELLEKEKQQIEQTRLTQQELEVCAYIQTLIKEQGGETQSLRYRKSCNGYVDVCCLYNFLRIKFAKKGKYILIKKGRVSITNYITEACTQSEGGAEFVRVYFLSPFDLKPLAEYIFKAYSKCCKSMREYASNGRRAEQKIEDVVCLMHAITDEEIYSLLESAEKREYAPVDLSLINKSRITRKDVVINAIHSRVPLNNIENIDDWDKGYEMGSPYWREGETARKEGKLVEAIQLFDQARYFGYDAPVLYISYGMAYRGLKDYSNEIVILDEGIPRIKRSDIKNQLKARRDKAINLLFAQQETARKAAAVAQLKK